MTEDAQLRVDLGPRSYDIRIGTGLLAAAGRHLAPQIGDFFFHRIRARSWIC